MANSNKITKEVTASSWNTWFWHDIIPQLDKSGMWVCKIYLDDQFIGGGTLVVNSWE